MTIDSTQPLEVDINNIATDLNMKCERDMVNCTRPYVESRVAVGGGTLEIWSDGYCIQSGVSTGRLEGNCMRIMFHKAFKYEPAIRILQPILDVSDTGYYVPRQINNPGEYDSVLYYMYLNGQVTTNNPYVRWRAEGWIR